MTRLAHAAVALALALAAASDRVKELEHDLTAGNPKQKRDAVIELAKLDTLEAWKLVVGALDNPLSQAADEAELQIAAIDDDKARELLLGKEGLQSKKPMVRARVVEAFARMKARPANAILAVPLDDKDALVRRTAAWTIERSIRDGQFKEAWKDLAGMTAFSARILQAYGKEKDPETRAALAISSNLALENPDAHALVELSADKSAPVRAAALILARELPPDAGLPTARKLASDPSLGVRLNAAELLASWKTKPAALELVAQLEAEKELRARWRMCALLRGLSGLAHRLDARPWRDWANALPADWKGEVSEVQKHDDEPTTVAFAGLPLLSERVCFLIDLSGSVWQAGKQGKTKKQIIDEELKKTLLALPASAEFNVIPYTVAPIPWQERIVPANEKNVAKAIEFFEHRSDNGTGNFWDAFLLALQDERVDTVVVLTDGAPTGGDRWNLGLMRQLLAERNRFRRVALDAVLADARANLKDDWVAMCTESGGKLVEIALK